MGSITDLTTNLKTRVADFLGPDYSELGNVTEIEKNSFKGANKRYGLLAEEGIEVDGPLKLLTVDQTFRITLTDGYFSNSLGNDIDKRTKTQVLQDLTSDLYVDLINSKAGSPAIVYALRDFSLEAPSFLEDDHVVAISFTVTIKYRTPL